MTETLFKYLEANTLHTSNDEAKGKIHKPKANLEENSSKLVHQMCVCMCKAYPQKCYDFDTSSFQYLLS